MKGKRPLYAGSGMSYACIRQESLRNVQKKERPQSLGDTRRTSVDISFQSQNFNWVVKFKLEVGIEEEGSRKVVV